MNKQRIALLVLAALLLLRFSILAQDEDRQKKELMIQPRKLIDCQTAGVLPKAHFDLETRIYPSAHKETNGAGLAFSFNVGITDRLNLGGGYGGDGVIGRDSPKGNPYPAVFIKYRLLEETFIRPALALGVDPTGYGGIEDDSLSYKGYIYKSQGIYAALSKNYLLFKRLSLGIHGAVNYSFEDIINRDREVKWPNIFLGIDLAFNEELALSAEYDMALNQRDPEDDNYANPLNGFLSFGLRWNIVPNLYFEFLAKDITSMKQKGNTISFERQDLGWSRELKLVYVASFLNRRSRDE